MSRLTRVFCDGQGQACDLRRFTASQALEYDDISSRARFVAKVCGPAGVGFVADSVSLEKFAVMSENTFSVSSR